MGRNKVKYELISNESVRKVTLKKRKAGLLKKLNELTTLCGVAACAIIFSTYNDTTADVWPSPIEALRLLEKFKKLPAKKQGMHMMDQNTFLERSISQLNERLEKLRKKNREMEMELVLSEHLTGDEKCYDLNNLEQLKELVHLLTKKIDIMGFKA